MSNSDLNASHYLYTSDCPTILLMWEWDAKFLARATTDVK